MCIACDLHIFERGIYMRLPNGFGSVHKLPGNRRKPYRVRITVGWKSTNEYKKQEFKTVGYYATKEEGLMALAEFNSSPYNLDNKNVTFDDIYQRWSKEHYSKIVPSSKRIWLAAYNHSQKLYSIPFRNIKVADMENVINCATVGNATKSRMKCLYNMMYKYAIKHEITDKNYAMYCDVPRVETERARIPFNDEEIELLWKNVDQPFVDMILINIYSGLRPTELVELKSSNVDLVSNVMVGGIKTDAGKNRVVPIHNLILDLIKNRYDVKNEKLFVDENGIALTYNSYRNRFIKVMNMFGMTHRPHDARHTFITKAKFYKVDEYILKLVVGHKIADITESVYTHRKQSEINDEINKIKK